MTDNILPDAPWTFDEAVTACFPDMLRRSIPGLDMLRSLTTGIAVASVTPGTAVLDLGASRGDAVAPLIDRFGAACAYHLVESAAPMADVLRERFPFAVVHRLDLADAFPPLDPESVSAALRILTLQFVPVECRPAVLAGIHRAMAPGAVLLIAEKIIPARSWSHALFTERYHAIKHANGYTPEQILAKARSLRNVLVPLTEAANVELLRGAGFRDIECYWRVLNFAAWVARR